MCRPMIIVYIDESVKALNDDSIKIANDSIIITVRGICRRPFQRYFPVAADGLITRRTLPQGRWRCRGRCLQQVALASLHDAESATAHGSQFAPVSRFSISACGIV